MASTLESWPSEPLGLKKKVSDLDLVHLELQNLKPGSAPKIPSDGHRIPFTPNHSLTSSSSDITVGVDEESSPFIPETQKSDGTIAADKNSKIVPEKKKIPIQWLLLALLAHAGWGIYPVLARYLQTREKLPSMSLLITGNGAVSLVAFIIVMKRKRFLTILKLRILPLLVFVTIIRVVTNLLSPKFTMAVNVQLMTLMAPLIVAVMNTVFLKEKLPPYTPHAIFFCTLGSVLMLLSSIIPFRLSVSSLDWIGIALAFASAVFLASYMVLVKKTLSDNPIKGEELLFFLTFPVVIVSGAFSLILREDWSTWTHVLTTGWIIWTAFAFGVILFGNLLQIVSIEKLGAPLVSTLSAFRMVSALVFSAFVMDEQLTDVYQFVGAIIVLITVSAYLWFQNRQGKK